MATVITGDATVHGIPNNGSTITYSGLGVVSAVLDSLTIEHEFETNELKDTVGHTCSVKAWDERANLTVDMTIIGVTTAAAATNFKLPSPLATVTIANMKASGTFDSTEYSLYNGKWLYMGSASIKQDKNGDLVMTGVKLKRWAVESQNDSLTTQVA